MLEAPVTTIASFGGGVVLSSFSKASISAVKRRGSIFGGAAGWAAARRDSPPRKTTARTADGKRAFMDLLRRSGPARVTGPANEWFRRA
jgi:hypothetical protein